MSLEQIIKTRRSVRNFSNKKVEKEKLEKIIEAGTWAPSHCNTQGWKFIVIDDPKIKNKIFDNGGSYVIKNAPCGILVLYDKSQTDNLEFRDYIQSSSAAIQNMLLTAHDLELGACWICHLPSKKDLKKIVGIKSPYTPIAYIALGHSNQLVVEIPRKNKLEDVYSFNNFPWPEKKTPIKIHLKRFLRKIYYKLPNFIKKIILPLVDKFVKKFKN